MPVDMLVVVAVLVTGACCQCTVANCDGTCPGCDADVKAQLTALSDELMSLKDLMRQMNNHVSHLECVESPEGTCLTHIDTSMCDTGHFAVVDCNTPMTKQSGYFTLDASNTTHVKLKFCWALEPSSICDDQGYQISVELYSLYGISGSIDIAGDITGHPGIAFNRIDHNNFDLIYFRPHSKGTCYQTAYLEKGMPAYIESKACSTEVLPRTWFSVKIIVTQQKADVYVNDVHVVSMANNFPLIGKAGIGVGHGYQNIIRFRNFEMKEM